MTPETVPVKESIRQDAVIATASHIGLASKAIDLATSFAETMQAGRPFDARHAARQLMETALKAYDVACMAVHQRIDPNSPPRYPFVTDSDVEGG